ncbi:protein of unassigned function [Methylobacterium oryzae CBMB20]|uniref:Protein of unassigned function n=1 Tax=Methylobacterium oryzae CBMB20 TaxID=693986 RepID=A0A089NZK7_9HYPH|nr:protein of unassigned function [Methylobacterium oryzae CBMB20]
MPEAAMRGGARRLPLPPGDDGRPSEADTDAAERARRAPSPVRERGGMRDRRFRDRAPHRRAVKVETLSERPHPSPCPSPARERGPAPDPESALPKQMRGSAGPHRGAHCAGPLPLSPRDDGPSTGTPRCCSPSTS